MILFAFAVFSGVSFGQATIQPDPKDGKAEDSSKSANGGSGQDAQATTDLLDGDFFKQWQVCNPDPAVDPSMVWKVVRGAPDAEPVLVCLGEPKGFLISRNQYADFELTLEWKYPSDINGNSGVLVYTQNEPRIWPTSVQVQLHQPKAGSIFPSGDATTDNTRDADPDLARPVNTWNECRIVSRGGRIAVEINGKKAGEISGAKPATGGIALQSEGSEVHFRRIRVRPLAPADSPPEELTPPPKIEMPSPSTDSAFFEFDRRGRQIRHDLNRNVASRRRHSHVADPALTYCWTVKYDDDGRYGICSRGICGHAGISHDQLPKMRRYCESCGGSGVSPVQVLRFPDSAGGSVGRSNPADGCVPGF